MDHDTTKLILAYLEKRLTPEEQQLFEQRMETSHAFRQEVADMRSVYEMSLSLSISKSDHVQKRWNALSSKMNASKKTDKKISMKIWTFVRTAAAVLFLPLLLSTLYFYNRSAELYEQNVQDITLTSPSGVVTHITLPDGSKVWLNSQTTLTYPQRFVVGRREVHLSGEAFFEVSADKENRFDVMLSNGLRISAYGTEFNVNAYPGDDYSLATLTKGNIEIGGSGFTETKVINPGEQLSYKKSTKTLDISKTNLMVANAWKDGQIIFRRTPMNDVVKILSRHFHVDIKLDDDALQAYVYSATFKTETLTDILDLLKKTSPIDYQIIEPAQIQDLAFSKKTIIIKAK